MLTLQRLTIQFFLDILYFPIWWYTSGILAAFSFLRARIRDANDQFVPLLWLTHLFVPMYGQYDWQGRIMSVFMRLVNVIGRTIALLIWSTVIFAVTCIWIFAPILLVGASIWSVI